MPVTAPSTYQQGRAAFRETRAPDGPQADERGDDHGRAEDAGRHRSRRGSGPSLLTSSGSASPRHYPGEAVWPRRPMCLTFSAGARVSAGLLELRGRCGAGDLARMQPARRRQGPFRRSRCGVGRDRVTPPDLLIARPLGAESRVGAAVVRQARGAVAGHHPRHDRPSALVVFTVAEFDSRVVQAVPSSSDVELGELKPPKSLSPCYQPQTTAFSLVNGASGSGATPIADRLHRSTCRLLT